MKKIVIYIIIVLFIPNVCFAKNILDNSRKISFETSNQWYISSLGEDPLTHELITIVYNNDTFIRFTQSNYRMKYKNLKQATDEEINELRDYMIRYYINVLKTKGYTFFVNKTDCFQNSIVIGATIKNDKTIGRMISVTYIKDYIGYIVVAICTDESANETLNTLSTLRIEGVRIDDWMQQ